MLPSTTIFPQKIYIGQVQLSPQSVLDKTSLLQNAVNWGLGVSSFFLSLFMLAAFLRFVLNTGEK